MASTSLQIMQYILMIFPPDDAWRHITVAKGFKGHPAPFFMYFLESVKFDLFTYILISE